MEFSWDEQNMVHIKRAKDFLFIIWLTVDQWIFFTGDKNKIK